MGQGYGDGMSGLGKDSVTLDLVKLALGDHTDVIAHAYLGVDPDRRDDVRIVVDGSGEFWLAGDFLSAVKPDDFDSLVLLIDAEIAALKATPASGS
jgi:hypothetical protein